MKRLATALSLIAVAVLLTPTGAVTETVVPRDGNVAVSEKTPYFDVATEPIELSYGKHHHVELVRVTNRYRNTLDRIEVSVEEGSQTPPKVVDGTTSEPQYVRPGEDASVTASVVCAAADPRERITLHVRGYGDDLFVGTTETVSIRCTGPSGQPMIDPGVAISTTH